MMDKDDLITGLENGGCLGTSNHNLITFNMWCMCFKKHNYPKLRQKNNRDRRDRKKTVDESGYLRVTLMSNSKVPQL